MSNGKTATLSIRIEPNLKETLRAVAEREHRSIANMVEVMIREYCGRVGVGIADQTPTADAGHAAKSNQK
ncbi:ribbon-helix-helix protein, CopG family [Achromobacter mucicolens]|uniref:ribbon-helix-helix protein, CopG family n=1 Tax=Achromobacter mucicolens TaxID=1389922 RepID=UPI0022F3F5F2|nr:CopG family transcriptional regulator [Achromobacter mucicolens]WBX89120.1 ribbon-helix-helix domain-containing protein [Achromobacter mucicolens]